MWRYNGARESDEKNFVSHHALFFFHFFSSKKKKSKQIFFSFFGLCVFLTHFWSVGCLFLPSFFSPLQRETTLLLFHTTEYNTSK